MSQFKLSLILISALWLLSPDAPFASSSSSRIRRRFHNRSKFDNDGHLCRYAARRNDASSFVRIIASRMTLSYLVIVMSPSQSSSVQRLVAFARDMTAHGPIRPGLIVVSGAAARDGQQTIADLRSGGQTDSDCAASWLQITNVHLGSSYRFQLEGGFPRLVQRKTRSEKLQARD